MTMADAWDEYLKHQQSPAPGAARSGGRMFGALFGGTAPGGGIQPNGQGLYTPGIMGQAQPGPATPINYAAIRNLLNSGVLRTGTVAAPSASIAAPAAEPTVTGPQNGGLARLFSIFGGMR
jgi:hypothetical protein